MQAISPEDEFLIEATCQDKPTRSWTRSTLAVAQHIADQAIRSLGYTHAEVRNTFGGTISDPLYECNATHSWDAIKQERKALT